MRRAPKGPDTPVKIDIRSVAARARVSIATVSRTINGLATVDPVLARRVRKAASELNYSPNPQARALVSGRSQLLGVIVSDITNPFFPELIQEFEQAAVDHGYEILIGSTNHDRKQMEVCARRMVERHVDAIAVMTFAIEEELLQRFAGEGIPLVSIDVRPKSEHSAVLSVDYRTGIAEGVQHLADLGHRKIGFLSGPLHLRSAQARKSAFLESLHSIGLQPETRWLIEGDHTLEGGRDAMERILALPEWPTAIMCSNDMTAIGVQHALFEANLRVPENFSLIGFDDIHLAAYTIPPLTTVRMSPRDIARRAVASLLSHMDDKREGPPLSEAEIPTHLIVRRTTDTPRALATGPKRKAKA